MSTNAVSDSFDPLSPSRTAHLLGLALSKPERPIDRVIARLREPDGCVWIENAIERVGSDIGVPLRAKLLDSEPLPDELGTLKQSIKRWASEQAQEHRREGTLAYFLVLATAAAYYRQCLTSQSPEQLREALGQFCPVVAAPWRRLIERAIENLQRIT